MKKENIGIVIAALALVIALGVAILGGGQVGPQGPQGSQGLQGQTGERGPRGFSASSASIDLSVLERSLSQLQNSLSLLELENVTLGGLTNYDEIAPGDAAIEWHSLTLESGEDQAVFTNPYSFTLFADLGRLSTDGTASSSFNAYLAATTSSSIPDGHDLLALDMSVNKSLIRINIATSTVASTTDSVSARVDHRGEGLVPIKARGSMILYLQMGDVTCFPTKDAACTSGAEDGGCCEAATSTARGFDVDATFRTHATSTTR